MRRFFLLSASLLCLALTLTLGFHLGQGTLSASPIPTEVAVLSGVINNGQEIPLPVYRDGTAALARIIHKGV